ncbi:hypothetical protein HPB50_008444 [Hyalomma asiaticum]|uniref:Uncharacterized protein n=1 Tax=Hyalomma asiaticum TaxID=266040 RepID=A0ACB7TED2_HYAAI|nr:hypothetical protein HPB50_008444 [Hyalomma asiaticum]
MRMLNGRSCKSTGISGDFACCLLRLALLRTRAVAACLADAAICLAQATEVLHCQGREGNEDGHNMGLRSFHTTAAANKGCTPELPRLRGRTPGSSTL